MEGRALHPGVVPAALGSSQQEALLGSPLGQDRWTTVDLGVSQGFRKGLITRLGQQEDADDADQSAAGEDDVVKEIALLIVQLHDGCSQHAEASTG